MTPGMGPAERHRWWRAFHEGPDSTLTDWREGGTLPYRPGGRVKGWVDGIVGDAIHGWAHDPGCPPVMGRVEVDGPPFANIQADIHRADVAAAGHGDGHCGFSLRIGDVPAGTRRVDFLLPCDEWCRVPGGPVIL